MIHRPRFYTAAARFLAERCRPPTKAFPHTAVLTHTHRRCLERALLPRGSSGEWRSCSWMSPPLCFAEIFIARLRSPGKQARRCGAHSEGETETATSVSLPRSAAASLLGARGSERACCSDGRESVERPVRGTKEKKESPNSLRLRAGIAPEADVDVASGVLDLPWCGRRVRCCFL